MSMSAVLTPYSIDSFNEKALDLSITSKNKFFPLYVMHTNKNLVKDVFSYTKPLYKGRIINKLSYPGLIQDLRRRLSLTKYCFSIKENSSFIFGMKGLILDENFNILLAMSINSTNPIITYDKDDDYDEIDTKKVKLFVSTEFLINPVYKNLYKKIHTDYILKCYEEKIETVFTTSEKIDSSLFGNDFKVEYNSLTELTEHLNNPYTIDALFFNEDDYIVGKEYDIFENSSEEGPVEDLLVQTDLSYSDLPF